MTLTDDTFYELLGNERRRACLKQLAGSQTEWSVSDLATTVATDITDSSTSPEEIYDSVYISLCQNHLPKLDGAAVIDYNHDAQTVTPGPDFPAIADRLPTNQPEVTPKPARTQSVVVSAATVVLSGAAVATSATVAFYLLVFILLIHLSMIFLIMFRQVRTSSELPILE